KHQLYDKPENVYFPGFIIFNQRKDYKVIEFGSQGWYFSCGNFLSYIYSYLIALDKSNVVKNIRKIEVKGYDFDISQDYSDYEITLLSEELMDLELKHFLEGLEITDKIKQEIYYPEMVRRGYVDILNNS
ncbi:MAG: hypothetical protein AAFQ80_12090, partial [Cyanobacteria bacterium J06621_8]